MDLWSFKVNEAEELCFFPVDNRRRGRKDSQSVDILRAKVDETASDARLFPGPPMSNVFLFRMVSKCIIVIPSYTN